MMVSMAAAGVVAAVVAMLVEMVLRIIVIVAMVIVKAENPCFFSKDANRMPVSCTLRVGISLISGWLSQMR